MQTIFTREDYKVFDSLKNQKSKIGPVGWVRMFMNADNKLPDVDGPNLIVAQGREFAAQKLFEICDNGEGGRPNFYGSKISHFAVGCDGSSVDGDIVTITEPLINDTHLRSPIDLGNGEYLTEPSGTSCSVKPILTDGNILLEAVEYDSSTYYTQVKCTCVLNNTEPTGLDPEQAVEVSEAGLYFVGATNEPKLFSHICFAPKWKEKSSQTVIEWYIMF